jgi:hypothetical protein
VGAQGGEGGVTRGHIGGIADMHAGGREHHPDVAGVVDGELGVARPSSDSTYTGSVASVGEERREVSEEPLEPLGGQRREQAGLVAEVVRWGGVRHADPTGDVTPAHPVDVRGGERLGGSQ